MGSLCCKKRHIEAIEADGENGKSPGSNRERSFSLASTCKLEENETKASTMKLTSKDDHQSKASGPEVSYLPYQGGNVVVPDEAPALVDSVGEGGNPEQEEVLASSVTETKGSAIKAAEYEDADSVHNNLLLGRISQAVSCQLNITPPRTLESSYSHEQLVGFVWNRRYQPTRIDADSYPFLDFRDRKQRYSYCLRRMASENWTTALRCTLNTFGPAKNFED